MFEEIWDCLRDALIDSAKLLPILFLIYLLMEILEHKMGSRFPKLLGKTSKVGPLAGGLLGVVPQCGLAAASASLFSGRVITLGTLMAVFLSSSDEMLPILISEAVPILTVLKIVGVKVLIAVVSGYVIDLVAGSRMDVSAQAEAEQVFENYEHHSNPILCALKKTVEIFIYILIFSFILNLLISFIGEDRLAEALNSVPVLGEVVAGLVGLIPNCASSIVITELFLDGIIGAGQMFAGLLVNAGVGTLVLLKTNKDRRQNLMIIGLLYVVGVIWGVLISLVGLVF